MTKSSICNRCLYFIPLATAVCDDLAPLFVHVEPIMLIDCQKKKARYKDRRLTMDTLYGALGAIARHHLGSVCGGTRKRIDATSTVRSA